ncbi:MAG: PRC-barrel domain-containing protein [Candidatus Lindowbacteria bacterium]|nr:PRC-barrel domain-containing protein [Candidatus Lindowbacteria bacterium]
MKKMLAILVGVAFAVSTLLSVQALAGEKAGTEAGKVTTPGMSYTGEKAAKGVFQASKLIGRTVRNEQGEKFGSVEELLFADDGHIRYLVLAGEADKLVPIPWSAVKSGIREDAVIFNISRSRFDSAPTFGRNEWQRFDDPEWNKKVHAYYEAETGKKMLEHEKTMKEEHPTGMKEEHPSGMKMK